jgi:glycosyltransferase involved in cell wall biosynthesis
VTRFAIDARPAVEPRRTGVGVYTDAIVRHLPHADPDTSYVAWYLDIASIGARGRRFAGWAPNLTEKASRAPVRAFRALGARLRVPRLEWLVGDVDLFLATNFLPPPTARPERCVLVAHDMAWKVLPGSAPHHNERWRRLFRRAVRTCGGVIVPSAAVAADLEATGSAPAGSIEVIHHGVDADAFHPVSPPEVEDVRRRHGIDGPYVLFVGGLEPRKNLETLVAAFARLEYPISLVVAGGRVRWAPAYAQRVERAIAELPEHVQRRVIRTGYVSDEDRRAMLSGAEVLAYPSRYEGFGFPVLEGFAANVPVLTSRASCLPEIAGDAALLVDPDDPGAIADGLAQLLDDEDLRNVLRAAGTARVASFTWQRCARATAAMLHRVAS